MKTTCNTIIATLLLSSAFNTIQAIPAVDLAQIFKKDRTEANRMYKQKEVTISGMLSKRRSEVGSHERIVLDDVSAVLLDTRKEDVKQLIKALREAEKEEDERVKDAREWAHDYKRKYKRYGGRYRGKRMERYADEMNDKGPTEKNLQLEFTATGICRGVRDGHVLIEVVTEVNMIPVKDPVKAAEEKNDAQTKALAKTSWALEGIVYAEHGQRYFAPTAGQFGLDFWSITLTPKVGNVAIAGALNKKKAVLEFDSKPARRGIRGIRFEHVKLKAIKPIGN